MLGKKQPTFINQNLFKKQYVYNEVKNNSSSIIMYLLGILYRIM